MNPQARRPVQHIQLPQTVQTVQTINQGATMNEEKGYEDFANNVPSVNGMYKSEQVAKAVVQELPTCKVVGRMVVEYRDEDGKLLFNKDESRPTTYITLTNETEPKIIAALIRMILPEVTRAAIETCEAETAWEAGNAFEAALMRLASLRKVPF